MKELNEEYLPFGMRIHERNEMIAEGAPMSELTRKVLMNLISSAKKWKDGARNKDELYNAENIKAAEHNRFGNHTSILDNGEHYNQDQTKVAQNGIREDVPNKGPSKSKLDLSKAQGSYKAMNDVALKHPDLPKFKDLVKAVKDKFTGQWQKRKAGK